jgi:hypothetical protein
MDCQRHSYSGRADGKIFVEAERARLTRQLAKMKEEDGKVGRFLHGIYNQSALMNP